MATFWKWCVFIPALAALALSLAAGYASIVEWPLALAVAATCGMFARAASAMQRVASKRDRRQAIIIQLAEARDRIGRSQNAGVYTRDRAA